MLQLYNVNNSTCHWSHWYQSTGSLGTYLSYCHRILMPEFLLLFMAFSSIVAVTCSPANSLQITAALSYHGCLPWPGQNAGHSEGPSGHSLAIKELVQEVSPWPSRKISVWVMPSVYFYTHYPLELKAEYFHSRSLEGVALWKVITRL